MDLRWRTLKNGTKRSQEVEVFFANPACIWAVRGAYEICKYVIWLKITHLRHIHPTESAWRKSFSVDQHCRARRVVYADAMYNARGVRPVCPRHARLSRTCD